MTTKPPMLSPDELLRCHNRVKLIQEGRKAHVPNQFWRELIEKKSQFIPKVWGDFP